MVFSVAAVSTIAHRKGLPFWKSTFNGLIMGARTLYTGIASSSSSNFVLFYFVFETHIIWPSPTVTLTINPVMNLQHYINMRKRLY